MRTFTGLIDRCRLWLPGPNPRRLGVLVALLFALPVATASASPPPGTLLAFGDNGSGQLGNTTNNGTSNANPTPAAVSLPGGNGTVTDAAAGPDFSLVATSSGQLFTFGSNALGQLGFTFNSGTSNANPSPTQVSLPAVNGSVTQLAAGSNFSLVVTSGGQLYAFGDNKFGQLGKATNNGTDNPNPTPALVSLPGEIGSVTQVAAGAGHSLVVTSSGQLYAFGFNSDGELGRSSNNGTENPNPTPTQVTLPGEVGPVTQVAAGGYFSLALTQSGQVYAFGHNAYGQLGNSTNNGTSAPNPTPTLVTLPGENGPVTQIAAGTYHSLALTQGGQLYAWGYNYEGELGHSTNNGTSSPNPLPTLVGLPGQSGRVTQISAGDEFTLAVTSGGQLYGFGENFYGNLGTSTNNGTDTPNPAPAQATLSPGTAIDTLAKGDCAEQGLAIVSGLAITTASLSAGQPGTAYSAALTASGGAAPLTWSAAGLPAHLSINPASGVISGTPSSAGGFPIVVTVTDSYGSQTSRSYTLTISAPAPAVSPAVSDLTQSHTAWREENKPAGRRRKPVGTTFSFTLNEPAQMLFTFTRATTGRKLGGKCVAATRRNRRHRVCARTITAGTLSITGHVGRNSLSFRGRLSASQKLRPGRYMLVIIAQVSGRTSSPATINFTVVPNG